MPTLNEVPEVAKLLATLLTGEPVTHGALAVVPLLAPNLDDPDWLTLEETGTRARVTEVSEAGSVPFLQVANGADRPLLLLDGEELIGAKQNRILTTTVLVAAHTEVTIPVSCVEQGRWGYRGRQFRPGDASLYASLRARKAAHVSQSVRAGRGHRADQGEVWAHLADRASQLRVDSATGAMRDVYARHQTDLTAARQALAVQPGQVGALVYIAGRWVGLDLLAGPGLFGRAWPVSARAMWPMPLAGSPSPASGWTPASSSPQSLRVRPSPRRRSGWAKSIDWAPPSWPALPWSPRGAWPT